jgi:ATP-dependent exoDNAse (exonuclease V) beta subunit
MDRVVVDPGCVTVVDWKTGAEGDPAAEHEEQVRGYLALLAGVYPGRRREGLLAYVDRAELRRVV